MANQTKTLEAILEAVKTLNQKVDFLKDELQKEKKYRTQLEEYFFKKQSKSKKNKGDIKSIVKKTNKIFRRSPHKNEIVVSTYKDGVLIHGSTFEHKDIIKSEKAFWNSDLKGWIVSKNSAENICNLLRSEKIQYLTEKLKNTLSSYGVNTEKINPPTKSKPDGCMLDSDSD